eukprot:scaffold80206_cov27-Tisochrysis_lutea.AAC.3
MLPLPTDAVHTARTRPARGRSLPLRSRTSLALFAASSPPLRAQNSARNRWAVPRSQLAYGAAPLAHR